MKQKVTGRRVVESIPARNQNCRANYISSIQQERSTHTRERVEEDKQGPLHCSPLITPGERRVHRVHPTWQLANPILLPISAWNSSCSFMWSLFPVLYRFSTEFQIENKTYSGCYEN